MTRAQRDAIVAHAERDAPNECCGYLSAKDGVVEEVFEAENERHSPYGYALTDAAPALLVLGSSLAVMSGLRFVRHAARRGIPVMAVTRGPTRGDDLMTLRVDGSLAPTLGMLVRFASAA